MNAVDTNVLIYACDARDPAKQHLAQRFIAELRDGVLLWQVACEFINASRKLGKYGFTPDHAWAQLGDLMGVFPLVTPTTAALQRARALHIDQQLAFWDAMVIGSCLDAGVLRLYSEDLPGGSVPALEIINPFT